MPNGSLQLEAMAKASSTSLHNHMAIAFFEFPEDIGGRFSVLSNVGLFPMAVAGVDIAALVKGAMAMERELKAMDITENPAVQYAVNRNLLCTRGFGVESLVVFEPSLVPFARWWTQLFAETEGKTEQAVFPTYFRTQRTCMQWANMCSKEGAASLRLFLAHSIRILGLHYRPRLQ